ncbi:hypothetical protein AVEN_213111-1 [Araneus ventricosus]|uniref:Reverse transcriptase domain-containing protein n=1 Tax=Araneus ventricosus TaxID=182803 RepID=A0A4Y2N3J7_ARAVE|nr:hypothetical protein AVEN_213111-1 [Araneus ventricosus]
MGIFEPIEKSDWATPVVPVIKPDGSVRICAYFKVILNPVLEDIDYPLPRMEDMFAKLSNGKFFSKIDLSPAYLHMPKQGLPVLNATRLLDYAIFLSGFDYNIKYQETKKQGNADALSRLPLKVTSGVLADIADVFEIGQIETMPVTTRNLARILKVDLELKPLYEKLLTEIQ